MEHFKIRLALTFERDDKVPTELVRHFEFHLDLSARSKFRCHVKSSRVSISGCDPGQQVT